MVMMQNKNKSEKTKTKNPPPSGSRSFKALATAAPGQVHSSQQDHQRSQKKTLNVQKVSKKGFALRGSCQVQVLRPHRPPNRHAEVARRKVFMIGVPNPNRPPERSSLASGHSYRKPDPEEFCIFLWDFQNFVAFDISDRHGVVREPPAFIEHPVHNPFCGRVSYQRASDVT